MRIISPWKNRRGYVSIMLSTLKEAIHGHDDVHVTMYNNESRQFLPRISCDYGGQLSSVRMPSRVGCVSHPCHFVFIDIIDHAFAHCDDDFVVNIDSDCCVHPEFIKAAKQMIVDIPELGHASLYNEGNHPEPKKTFRKVYHKREHISMTASIISRKLWEMFPKPEAHQEIRAFWEPHLQGSGHAGGIDGALSTFAHQTEGFGCFSTVRSYVDHIGAIGQYSTQSSDGISNNHRARRFNP